MIGPVWKTGGSRPRECDSITPPSAIGPRSGSRLDSKSGLARFEPSAGCHYCRRATRSRQSADNRPTRKRSSRFDSCCGNHFLFKILVLADQKASRTRALTSFARASIRWSRAVVRAITARSRTGWGSRPACEKTHQGELSGIGIAPAPKADWPSAPRVWEFKPPTRRQSWLL